jgi:hypothetical protein
MKKWGIILILMAYPFIQSFAFEDLATINSEALAFFAAKDYSKASDLYERLLNQGLPSWQKTLLLYNLGTIQLRQGHLDQALELYQSIPLNSIASPRLLRDLRFNEALLHLRRVDSIYFTNAVMMKPDEQFFLIERGLERLRQARELDCLIRKFENPADPCSRSSDIEILFLAMQNKMNQIRQQQREELLKNQEIEQTTSLLINSLQQLLSLLDTLSFSTLPNELATQYWKFLAISGLSLTPIWEQLNNQFLDTEEKNKGLEALQNYQAGIHLIEQHNIEKIKRSFLEVLEKLTQIEKKYSSPSSELKSVLFYHKLLLMEDSLSIHQLKKLIKKQAHLNSSFSKEKKFQLATQNLSMTEIQLQEGHERLARFFLANSAFLMEELVSSDLSTNSPQQTLKMAINKAKQAFELNALSQSATLLIPLPSHVHSILLDKQEETLEFVPLFIKNLLILERKKFQEKGRPTNQNCQKKPWDQVVPIFEKGYQEALIAKEALSQEQLDQALASQGETIIQWEQALDLIKEQETQHQEEEKEKEEQQENSLNEAHEPINETFNLLQEMETEDAPVYPETNQEINAW